MLYFFERGEHMPELGQFLKEKREFSGLSLKKLSSVTGISDSELLKIEMVLEKNLVGNIFVKLQKH